MNNGKIYINISDFDNGLNKFKSAKEKISKVYESQKKIIKDFSECWGGNTGEEVCKRLTEHNKNYENYLKEIDEKITFLENVRQSYNKMDESISAKIDMNAKV